jgi:hypothetical protein
MVPLPLPLSVKESPLGSPAILRLGVGSPFAFTEALNAVLTYAVLLVMLDIFGVLVIVNVNACVAVPLLFFALIVKLYVPASFALLKLPLKIAVPSLLSFKITPLGKLPLPETLLIFGIGSPVVSTVKLNGTP